MKILILGASGYLGARLTEYFSNSKFEVYAQLRKLPPNSEKWANKISNIILGDIQDDDFLNKIAALNIDAVIYTISLDHHQSESNIDLAMDVNIRPIWKLLEKFYKQRDSTLKKFIFFSTQQIYGRVASDTVDENYNPRPVNNYGLTHLLAENILNLYKEKANFQTVNLRLSNCFGPPVFHTNNCWWLVINDFCKSAVENKEIKLLSDGSPQRDFISITALSEIIKQLLDLESWDRSALNIGSGNTLTILELAHLVAGIYKEIFKEDIPIILPDNNISSNADHHKNIDKFTYNINSLHSLGIQSENNMKNEIIRIFEFLRTHNG